MNEMSNERKMYTLKPIVSLPGAVHRPNTMYKMRNIHDERSRGGNVEAENQIVPDIAEQKPLPEFNALEVRQEKILAQLAELKKQVSTLRDFLKQTDQPPSASTCNKQELVNVDLIVKVNPKRPPYSVLALQKVWKDVEVNVQTYVHSSVLGEVPIVFLPNANSSKNNRINLSVIWKEVDDFNVVSSLHGYPIAGETNFLRYISRSLSEHNYEKSPCQVQLNATDELLDLCHCLHFQESLKKKQEVLSLIADKLDTNWINKNEPNIVDIAVWSTIKQVFPKKFPPKLNKWFETCEKVFI